MSKKLNKKGFTLIEVVLVLAIGGLIFLLAFLAFQQASTNRRDTSRRSDASRFVGEVQNYMSDHGSASSAPDKTTFDGTIFSDYLNSPKAPDGKSYVAASDLKTVDNVVYTKGTNTAKSACNQTDTLTAADYKIEIKLEKGTVCKDSL